MYVQGKIFFVGSVVSVISHLIAVVAVQRADTNAGATVHIRLHSHQTTR